jgi:hypothetical protein
MYIWAVDMATLRAEICQRNALRKSAMLPLIDEQKELEHACWLIRSKRWRAFKQSKQDHYQRFRDGIRRTWFAFGIHGPVGMAHSNRQTVRGVPSCQLRPRDCHDQRDRP